jgi:hypothetical protein
MILLLTGKKDRPGSDHGEKIGPSPVSVINPVYFEKGEKLAKVKK